MWEANRGQASVFGVPTGVEQRAAGGFDILLCVAREDGEGHQAEGEAAEPLCRAAGGGQEDRQGTFPVILALSRFHGAIVLSLLRSGVTSSLQHHPRSCNTLAGSKSLLLQTKHICPPPP